MRRDRFRLACPLQHEQLRKNRNRLEIYGKSPQYLRHGKAVIDDERKQETGSEQILDLERVDGGVVCGAMHGQRAQTHTWVTHRKRDFMR